MKLQFLGATEYVTGSCYLLTVGNFTALMECGLVQGGFDEQEKNHQAFAFDPKSAATEIAFSNQGKAASRSD